MAVNNTTYFSSALILFTLAYLVIRLETSIGAFCISLFLLCGGVYVAAKLIPRGRIDPWGRAVFITGCDTGFGHELALKLDKLGFTVFAGCLMPDSSDARKLITSSSSRIHIVPLDVTNEESVKSAKDIVINIVEQKDLKLHAVVNNAGIWRWGEIEWTPIDAFKKIADINLYGMIRVTQAFLPIVRRSKGRIINIGSISGLWSIPANSLYCMTKYSIESLSDTLRYEMHKWGVKVIIVEPGQYGRTTAIHKFLDTYADNVWQPMGDIAREDYGRAYINSWQKYYEDEMKACYPDASPVIDAMVDAVISRRPKHRYLVGNLVMTYLEAYWNSMLPSWLTDRQFYRLGADVATPAALLKTKTS